MIETETDGASVALVTGAAAGIGAATVAVLAELGYHVVGLDRDPAIEAVTGDVGGTPYVCDLTDVTAVERVIGDVVSIHGRLDLLVNNAGLAVHNPVDAIRSEDLDLMWAVNVRALVLLCRDAAAAMRSQPDERRGQIVNIVSTAGLRGGPGEAAYCATKFAVRGFTQGFTDECRSDGIRVHGIYPAGVDTGFWAHATAAGPGVDTGRAFLRASDVAAAVRTVVTQPPDVLVPELVIHARTDADLDAIERKLSWFRS